MLRIVLINLISNALKFTRPRLQAEIEIGCKPGYKERNRHLHPRQWRWFRHGLRR